MLFLNVLFLPNDLWGQAHAKVASLYSKGKNYSGYNLMPVIKKS